MLVRNLLDGTSEMKKGWKGHIRLYVSPIQFCNLQSIRSSLNLSVYHPPGLIDICSYISESDILHSTQFDDDKFDTRNERICRLDFDVLTNMSIYPFREETIDCREETQNCEKGWKRWQLELITPPIVTEVGKVADWNQFPLNSYRELQKMGLPR